MKSRMRENCTYGSVRGQEIKSQERWAVEPGLLDKCMEIRKKINITLKDYFFFNIGLIKKTLINYLIVLVAIAVIMNGIMNGFKLDDPMFYLKSLLFYVIGAVILIVYFSLLVYFASKKSYIPNKKYYENMDMLINEEGIYQFSEGAESGITYDKIYKVKENRLSFIIMINARQGILIPKKGFTTEELDYIRKKTNK